MSRDLRYEIEQRAVAIFLAWAAVCFVTGAVLQRTGKTIDRATTWGGGQR